MYEKAKTGRRWENEAGTFKSRVYSDSLRRGSGEAKRAFEVAKVSYFATRFAFSETEAVIPDIRAAITRSSLVTIFGVC